MIQNIANFELWATSLPAGGPALQLSTSEPLPFLADEPLVAIGSAQGYLIKSAHANRYCFIGEAGMLDAHLQQAMRDKTPIYLAQYTRSRLTGQWPLQLVARTGPLSVSDSGRSPVGKTGATK